MESNGIQNALKGFERLVRCSVRHWEALPINVAEQYRSRVEQLSHVLENLLRRGGQGGSLNARTKSNQHCLTNSMFFIVFLGCMLKKEPEPQVRVHRISW
jgi:hypothetical protein